MAGNAQEWESKITWDAGADTITDAEYGQILSSIFPEAWPSAAIDFHYTLKARHFIYSHSSQGDPLVHNGFITQNSDCAGGGRTNFDESTRAQGVVETGLSLGVKFDPEPISKTILGIVAGVMGFITKHHAQAVALEQKDICQATIYANQGFDVIDAGFYSGEMTQTQANTALRNLHLEFDSIVHPVETASGRTKSSCNAACVNSLFLQGLVKLRTDYLYPQYVFPSAISVVLPTAITGAVSGAGSAISDAVNGISGGAIKLSSGLALALLIIAIALTLGIVRLGKVGA